MLFSSPASVVDWLVSGLARYGLEGLFGKYYGTYRAIVEAVDDPERRGRVRVRVPALGQQQAPPNTWAIPTWPMASNGHGWFASPVVTDTVWVQFEYGDPDRPLLVGGFLARGAMPDEFVSEQAARRGIKTPAGHYVRFSDDPEDLHITISAVNGAYATMDKDGNVVLSNAVGSMVYLNAKDGQTTLMDASGAMLTIVDGEVAMISSTGSSVTVGKTVNVLASSDVVIASGGTATIKAGRVELAEGVQHPIVLGDTFQVLWSTHTHIGNLGGPTGPPIQPMLKGVHLSLGASSA